MKLFTTKSCPFAARIKVILALKNIDVEVVDPNEIGRDVFLESVSEGRVPALMLDDGKVLVESESICEYLEEAFPEIPVYPDDLLERVELRKWSRRADIDLGRCFVPFQIMKVMGKKDPILIEQAKSMCLQALNSIEKQFGSGPYAMGQYLTHVDGAWLTRCHLTEQMWKVFDMGQPFEGFPKLQAYRKILSENSIIKPIEDCYLSALLDEISKI